MNDPLLTTGVFSPIALNSNSSPIGTGLSPHIIAEPGSCSTPPLPDENQLVVELENSEIKHSTAQKERALKKRQKSLTEAFEKLKNQILKTNALKNNCPHQPYVPASNSPYTLFMTQICNLQNLFTESLNNSPELAQIQNPSEILYAIPQIWDLFKTLENRMLHWKEIFKTSTIERPDLQHIANLEYQKILAECSQAFKIRIQSFENGSFFSEKSAVFGQYQLFLGEIQKVVNVRSMPTLLGAAKIINHAVLDILAHPQKLEDKAFYSSVKRQLSRLKQIMKKMLTFWQGRECLEPLYKREEEFFLNSLNLKSQVYSETELHVFSHTALAFFLMKVFEWEIKTEFDMLNAFEARALQFLPLTDFSNLISNLKLINAQELQAFPKNFLPKLKSFSEILLKIHTENMMNHAKNKTLDLGVSFFGFFSHKKTLVEYEEDVALWDSLVWYQNDLIESIRRGELREKSQIEKHMHTLDDFENRLSHGNFKNEAQNIVRAGLEKLKQILEGIEKSKAAFDALEADLQKEEEKKIAAEYKAMQRKEKSRKRAERKHRKKQNDTKVDFSLNQQPSLGASKPETSIAEKTPIEEKTKLSGKDDGDNGIIRTLRDKLPLTILDWFEQFSVAGFELKVHGGFILDHVLNRDPFDLDLLTNASASFLESLSLDHRPLRRNPYKNNLFSTITQEGLNIEIWQSSTEAAEQAADFTVCSFVYDGKTLSSAPNAQSDFENRTIALLPHKCLKTEPSLILKAIRLCQKGFQIPDQLAKDIVEALPELKSNLQKNPIPYLVALKKLLLNGQARRTIEFLKEYGILAALFPPIPNEKLEVFLGIMQNLDKQFRKIPNMRQLGIASLPRIFSDFLSLSQLPEAKNPEMLFNRLEIQYPILQDWCRIMKTNTMVRNLFLQKIESASPEPQSSAAAPASSSAAIEQPKNKEASYSLSF
ncbi:MAG: hypothetical protein ACKOAD_00520 [Gammaproteobacteria bacterium]